MRYLGILSLLAIPLFAQNPYQVWLNTPNTPSGSCTAQFGYLVVPAGTLYTCQSGTWAQASGGTSFTPGSYLTLTSGVLNVDTTKIPTNAAIQAGQLIAVTATSSSASTYTGTMNANDPLAAYAAGQELVLSIGATACAGGAMTYNIDSLGAISLKQADGSTNLLASQCPASSQLLVTYDGTVFRLQSGPIVATQAACDNSTKVATTAYFSVTCSTTETSGSPLSVSAQSQIIWNNTASAYVVDLPATANGLTICIGNDKARSSAVSLVPPSGSTIYYKGVAGTTSSATGLVSGGAAGDFICTQATDSTTWMAVGPGQGTWTNN